MLTILVVFAAYVVLFAGIALVLRAKGQRRLATARVEAVAHLDWIVEANKQAALND